MTSSPITRNGYIARFLTACAFSLLLITTANAQAKQDFALHNKTGKTIKEVYISPTSTEDWGDDVLGDDDTLDTGDSTDITFSRRETANYWDILVVFRDGKESKWTKLNLSRITDLTISFKNGKPWATWKCVGCD